jgi:hypothetical protein
MAFNNNELMTIPATLSQPRFDTYLRARNQDPQKALALYQWNLRLSAAFIIPLHIVEISIRNAAVERLDAVHTPQWPWIKGFVKNLLPYHQKNLNEVARVHTTTGQVVAELKFSFWEKLFTSRFDSMLWDNHIHAVFPYAPQGMTDAQLRGRIYADIEAIRKLRNRIAHHEPIYSRPLRDDYKKIHELISWRDTNTAHWTDRIQEVTTLLAQKPT